MILENGKEFSAKDIIKLSEQMRKCRNRQEIYELFDSYELSDRDLHDIGLAIKLAFAVTDFHKDFSK